jgi:SIR2-like domain
MAFDNLVAAIRPREALAVTGAGLSIWAGYGTWQQLIDRLANAVRHHRGDEVNVDVVLRQHTDLLHLASRLGTYLGNLDFEAFIRDEFGPTERAPHRVLHTFAQIPFRHCLTFNFEESLERSHISLAIQHRSIACGDLREIPRLLRNLNSPCSRYIVHLHGKVSDPINRMALTEEGYLALYRDPLFKNLMWLLCATRTLVFVGFGFTDNDFLRALREGARDVRTCGSCHFAIVGLRPEDNDGERRQYFNENYLIEPVFYEVKTADGHQNHDGFVELIDQIATATGMQVQAPLPLPVTGAADEEELRLAESLSDRVVQRLDPGGEDVPG